MQKGMHPVQVIGGLVIDYFRWTQLTPMVLIWAIVVGLVLLTAFVNYEEQFWSTGSALAQWISQLPVVGPKFTAWVDAQQAKEAAEVAGAVSQAAVPPEEPSAKVADQQAVDAFDQLKSFALKAWGIISLVFMAFAWVLNRLFGPFEPWTLKRKLRLLALLCLMFPVAIAIGKFAVPDRVHGSVWLHGFLYAVFYFVVSAWCLSISHLLRWWQKQLMQADIGKRGKQEGLL